MNYKNCAFVDDIEYLDFIITLILTLCSATTTVRCATQTAGTPPSGNPAWSAPPSRDTTLGT